jgi:hypothetical protein
VSASTSPPRPKPDPVKVSGPASGGNGVAIQHSVDLAAVGYVEEEYFVEGDAASYTSVGELGADGRWTIEPAATAPYKTRIVVRRPQDAAKFNGVTVVEWLNVSAGQDGDPDWGYLHDELIREGEAWVGVSAQAQGIAGGQAILASSPAAGGIKAADPARYGSLSHPGDTFAYDIFTQAAASILSPDGPAPLGDLETRKLIASGESQSAFFMTSYVNGVQPLERLFDGFHVHSRAGAGPDFATARPTAGGTPTIIRTDTDAPVLIFQTETDLTVLGYAPARQDDSDMVRLWEAAGTSHADSYLLESVYGLAGNGDFASILNCPAPVNSGPQHEVIQAAFHHLVEWVENGTPPPTAPRLELTSSIPPKIARDADGNGLGGIRTGPVEAPIAALSGESEPGGTQFCGLFGSTKPFDAAKLEALYPTHDAYVSQFTAANDQAVEDGYLLAVDAEALNAEARASAVGA